MTAGQLYNACKSHQYLVLRYANVKLTIAVNCKLAMLKRFDEFKDNDIKTKFISYYPCGFMEYISKKIPYYFKPLI